MSDRPKFTPNPNPTVTAGGRTGTDWEALPYCEICGAQSDTDARDSVCFSCWRLLQVVRYALAELAKR